MNKNIIIVLFVGLLLVAGMFYSSAQEGQVNADSNTEQKLSNANSDSCEQNNCEAGNCNGKCGGTCGVPKCGCGR